MHKYFGLGICNINMIPTLIWIFLLILIHEVGSYITYTNSSNNIQELPDNIPLNVEKINLDNNKLTYINPELFSNYPSLIFLSIIGNNFQEIPDVGDLKSSLIILKMGRNKISEIRPDMFDGFESLSLLGIAHLGLTEFPDFGDISSVLTTLLMGYNKIVYINDKNIAKLTNLKRLHLDNNRLETFPIIEYPVKSTLHLKLDSNFITYMR